MGSSAPTRAEEGARRRWDEGLTEEERAEAKRKYRNRRGAERWRRRKWERLLRSTTPNPVEEALDGQVSAFEGQMLQGVGSQSGPPELVSADSQAEADLLTELEQIAAYALVPSGFQRHNVDIVLSAVKAMNILRGGAPNVATVAYKLSLGVQQRPEWFSPSAPNFTEVCTVFAHGQEREVIVPLTTSAKPGVHLTLKRMSDLPQSIQLELYMTSVKEIAALVPLALSWSQGSEAAIAAISQRCREVSMLLTTYELGHASSFSARRNLCQPQAIPISQLMSAAASLRLDAETCRELWTVWERTLHALEPHRAAQQDAEQEIERLVRSLDLQDPSLYVRLLEKVQSLQAAHEEIHRIYACAERKCFLEIMTPFQVGVMAAAQLPQITAKQALSEGIDPLPRISTVFEYGLIPYRPS